MSGVEENQHHPVPNSGQLTPDFPCPYPSQSLKYDLELALDPDLDLVYHLLPLYSLRGALAKFK